MNSSFIFYSLLIYLSTMTQTSISFGEDILMELFGIDSTTPYCELCDDWTRDPTETDTSIFQKLSTNTRVILENLSRQFQESIPTLALYNKYSVSLVILSMLMLLVLIQRKQKQRYGMYSEHASRRRLKLSPRKSQYSDKLRKTKKQRSYMMSKQTLTMFKEMIPESEDRSTFHENRQNQVSPYDPELLASGVQVFDLRERSDIPNVAMDTLLCIERDCAKHPHNYVKKYGNKIVCSQEAFGLNNSFQPVKSDLEAVENTDVVDDINGDGTSLDDIGPPCATSSFLSNSSSTSDTEDGEAVDPFSYLDETVSPNSSGLQKYLENSMTWFGGLYSSTRETSFMVIDVDNLNRSISRGLDEFERSFDVKEMQKNLSLYGYESDSVFQFAAICFIKKLIEKLNQPWLQLGSNKTKENILQYNTETNRDLNCEGCAVYNNSYDE